MAPEQGALMAGPSSHLQALLGRWRQVTRLTSLLAAVEVPKRLIPTVYADDQFQNSGRSLTLKAIQQFVPDALNDANLAKIQAEFDKLPAKG